MRCTHDDGNNNIKLGVMMFFTVKFNASSDVDLCPRHTAPTSLLTGVLNFTKLIYSTITKKKIPQIVKIINYQKKETL